MTTDKIKITMSERRPVTIVKADWPLIASASWYSGTIESQANYVARIRVRQHEDGRTIVYGSAERGPGGAPIDYRGAAAGYMLDAPASDEETVRAIRRVAGVIEHDELAAECIADLPDEEIGAPRELAVASDTLAMLLALLVQAVPHVPEPLKSEIRNALRAGA